MNTKMTKLALALGAMALAGGAWAVDTNSATAAVSATVVTPLTIAKISDMNFGTFAATSVAGVMKLGTTAVTTGSTNVKTFTSSPTAARFTVTGDTDRTFSIAYTDSSAVLTAAGGTMAVDWTAVAMSAAGTAATALVDGSDAAIGTLTAGVAEIYAGGNLTVGAYQPAGSYVGNFVVTVAYN